MLFKEIIGQETVKKHFINSVKNNRISHAMLFTGKKGVGKLAMAIAFSQYISCKNKLENDACGACSSCVKFQKLIHPDLHFVFPIVKGKRTTVNCDIFIHEWREFLINHPYPDVSQWYQHLGVKNAQGMIYADESEEIIRKLNLKTYESEYKTLIIWLPEKMHLSAANKLLKVIEEPYDKTLILLVSEEPEQIILTIRSRTQNIKIPPIDTADLETALCSKFDHLKEQISNIIRISGGSYFSALELIQKNEEHSENFNRFVEMMRVFYGRNILQINEWVEKIGKIGRETQKSFLKYALSFLRENFILNYSHSELNFFSEQEKIFSKKFSLFIHEKNIGNIYDEFSKTYDDIGRNANPRLTFLDLALKMTRLLRKD